MTDHLTDWDTRRGEGLKSKKVSTGWIIACTLCINYPIFFPSKSPNEIDDYHLPFAVEESKLNSSEMLRLHSQSGQVPGCSKTWKLKSMALAWHDYWSTVWGY